MLHPVVMPVPVGPELLTADELLHVDIPGKSTELVRGRLVVREPPGTRHGVIAANLAWLVTDHVRQHTLGLVFAQDTGFRLESNPDTVRGPDLAFLAADRAAEIPPRGYAALAPDLVAEIVSPDDRPGELLAKVGQFLDAGTRLIWVIDPQRTEARIYSASGDVSIVGEDGALDGGEVLPGFSCLLSDVLA